MAYNYSNKDYNKEHMARVVGRSLQISAKASIEVCNRLRGKSVAAAKRILRDVAELKRPVKYTRFTNGAGHKKGIGPGKYPQKTAGEILKLIDAVEANAQFKGLNTSDLIIRHISTQKAGNTWRYGRHKRRKMKSTHIELIVEEGKPKKEDGKAAENKSKSDKKPNAVPEQKKEDKKKEIKKAEEKQREAKDKK